MSTINLKTALVYEAVNEPVLLSINARARRILDLGCGSGALGARVKLRQECNVTGVTFSEKEAEEARARLDRVIVSDLNQFDPRPVGRFDCIVCSHVLEHLFWPEYLLERLCENFAAGGELVLALPNVMYWKQRITFLRGRFRYADGGLMDRTHFRFFDWQTAFQLAKNAGYEVTDRVAGGNFPLPFFRRAAPSCAAALDRTALRLLPNLFGWQVILIAHPRSR